MGEPETFIVTLGNRGVVVEIECSKYPQPQTVIFNKK